MLDVSVQAHIQPSHRQLFNLRLRVQAGELVTLCGPSGCGKSTLLRFMAGLISTTPSLSLSGTVRLNGEDMTAVDPYYRKIALIGQNAEELRIPGDSSRVTPARWLRLALDKQAKISGRTRLAKREAQEAMVEALLSAKLGADKLHLPIHTLSGGERQRVNIARVLAEDPLLVLADEPTSSLDPELKADTASELAASLRDREVTVVWVTHDLDESKRLQADRVVTMEELAVTATPPDA